MNALKLLLACAPLTLGCAAQYTYTAPETPEGLACAASCAQVREHCQELERARHMQALSKCAAEDQDRRMLCARVPECPPLACSEVSDEEFCEEGHRKCYRDCGGSVVQ